MGMPWADFGWTIFFTLSGLALTVVGLVVFDLLVPYEILEEIEHDNHAVAWVVFGFVASSGLVLHAAYQQGTVLLHDLGYAVIGLLLNFLGYFVWEWVTPKWGLNKAIKAGSVPAGIVVAGIFLAIGLTVSGSFGGGLLSLMAH